MTITHHRSRSRKSAVLVQHSGRRDNANLQLILKNTFVSVSTHYFFHIKENSRYFHWPQTAMQHNILLM